jgi:choline dehydrogenase-like flavoprotein
VRFFLGQTSTARIGASPETGVDDLRLRIFGVTGIPVLDASVFPNQISHIVNIYGKAQRLTRETYF